MNARVQPWPRLQPLSDRLPRARRRAITPKGIGEVIERRGALVRVRIGRATVEDFACANLELIQARLVSATKTREGITFTISAIARQCRSYP